MNVSFGNSFVLTCTAPRKMVAQDDAIKQAKELNAILGEREYAPDEQHEGKDILLRDVVIFKDAPAKDEQFRSFCLQRGINFKEIDEKEVFDADAIIDRATLNKSRLASEREPMFKPTFVVLDLEKLMEDETFKQNVFEKVNSSERIESGMSTIGQNKPFPAPSISTIGKTIDVSPAYTYTWAHNTIPALHSMGIKKMPFQIPYYAKEDFDKMGMIVRD